MFGGDLIQIKITKMNERNLTLKVVSPQDVRSSGSNSIRVRTEMSPCPFQIGELIMKIMMN